METPQPAFKRCGKVSYPDRKKARAAARTQRGRTGVKHRAYFCDQCHTWHLTSLNTGDTRGLRTRAAAKQGRQPIEKPTDPR